MNLDINIIRRALFAGKKRYYDFEAGDAYAGYLVEEGILDRPERYVVLPIYSRAPIYQSYLKRVFAELPIEDVHNLSAYPEFGFDGMDDPGEDLCEYLDQAYYAVGEIDNIIERNREAPSPSFDPSFPTFFNEYLNSFTTQFAKDWAKTEGQKLFGEPITWIS